MLFLVLEHTHAGSRPRHWFEDAGARWRELAAEWVRHQPRRRMRGGLTHKSRYWEVQRLLPGGGLQWEGTLNLEEIEQLGRRPP